MCNLSEGIVDRVTEQVTKRVAMKKDIDSVRALMRNTGWQVEKAMEALDIPESMKLPILKALAN